MLEEEIITFLTKVPPFSFLGREEIVSIVEGISLEYYPRGVKILAQNGPPSEYLRIIKKGAVKVFMISDEGEEIGTDYRSEGEQFGFVSLISGDRSRANIVAVEDTICYLIPKQKVVALQEKHPQVNEYFVKSFFLNFIDRTYEDTRKRISLLGNSERLLFTTPVGNIIKKKPVTTTADTTIKDAAGIMAAEDTSSVIIFDSEGIPAGIVTDRDLRHKVVARGRGGEEPVGRIMSSPLIRVEAGEFCFEALLRMIRYNIHHLLVVEDGELRGVVTNHDFMVLQGASPMVYVKEIEEAQSIEDLALVRPKMIRVVSELLREGARASNVTGLITELTEKFLNRMIDIIERRIGPSPLPYTLFMYDDGGRRELTLSLQIRLGVAFDDTGNRGAVQRTVNYFREFHSSVLGALKKCGFPDSDGFLNPGNIKSAREWKEFFREWSLKPFRNAKDPGLIDMRGIRGEDKLVDGLSEHLAQVASSNEMFMDSLATATVNNRPPLGFFKRFVVEKSGNHMNELNLYLKGIKPLVDSVRLFSLEKKTGQVSTLKRVQSLRDKHGFEQAEDITQAFEYLTTLIIHDQLEHVESGASLDSFLNPEELSTLEKKTLKESFLLISGLFDIIDNGYRTEPVKGMV